MSAGKTTKFLQIQKKLVKETTDHYLQSNDFNGFSLPDAFKGDSKTLKLAVVDLIKQGVLSIEFAEEGRPNPFVKILEPLAAKEQLDRLEKLDIMHGCLYPTPSHLETVVDMRDFANKPFTLKLVLGEPKLKFYSFNLKILKNFSEDPRYIFENYNDICGTIYTKDDVKLENNEEIYIKTWGYSHNLTSQRAMCVPLCYLSKLSPEQQGLWQAHSVTGFQPYDEYVMVVYGHGQLVKEISALNAFMKEIDYVNQITQNAFSENLFKNTNRPKDFSYLMMPTRKDFNDFICNLEILLCEGLDKSFFKNRGLIMDREKVKRKDGTIQSESKATISLLQEWLMTFSLSDDDKPKIKNIIGFMREINKLRSNSVHNSIENDWDENLFIQQREIIMKAVEQIRELRFIITKYTNSILKPEPYNCWVY